MLAPEFIVQVTYRSLGTRVYVQPDGNLSHNRISAQRFSRDDAQAYVEQYKGEAWQVGGKMDYERWAEGD